MNPRATELLDVDAIALGNRLREINTDAVNILAASMQNIGLRTPITVRMLDDEAISEPELVSGLHRLQAAKKLGWSQIECFVVDHESDDQARLWEIAENLHRSDLTALERSEHIAEWVRLSANLAETRTGRPGDAAHAARELNIPERTVRRAVSVDKLSDEAKETAQETGLDNNQAVLEAARRAPDDVAFLRAEHARREAEKARRDAEAVNRNTDAVIRMTEAEQFANWLMEHSDLSQMPVLISWLEGTKPRDVIAAMRRIAA